MKGLRSLMLVAALLPFWCSVACAETISIHGYPFEVEEISAVDAKNVKVRVFDAEVVVAKNEVDKHVVDAYFQPERAGLLSSAQIFGFIENAVKAEDYNAAAQAFQVLLLNPHVDEDELMSFVDRLNHNPRATKFFKVLLTEAETLKTRAGVLAALIFYAGQRDVNWVRTHCLRYVYLFGGQFRGFLRERFYGAVTEGNDALLDGILRLGRALLGADDKELEALELIGARFRQSMSSIAAGNMEGLLPLIDMAAKDASLAKGLPAVVTAAVQREAKKNIAKKDNRNALRVLALLQPEWCSGETLTLIGQVLTGFELDRQELPEETGIYNFLEMLSARDAGVKDAYIDLLERQLSLLIGQGYFMPAALYMNRLLRVRPDPSSANDRLRVEEALAYSRRGMSREAQGKLHEVRTGIPFFDRLRVLTSGVYLGPVFIIVLLLLLVVLVYVLRNLSKWEGMFRSWKQGEKRADRRKGMPKGEELDEVELPLFAQRGRGLDPKHQEYIGCLRSFELAPGASLKAIKTAYRNAVKEVHPDLMEGNQNAQDSARFIELTGTYERILELRKQLGIID